MEMEINMSINSLEICSYRYLQQLAKSMSLPSNVKKMHLIEMIRAKKFSTPAQLEEIICRVKLERKKITKKRVKRLQYSQKSPRSNTSPPIVSTPRHSPSQNNPNLSHTLLKYTPRRNIPRVTITNILNQTKSDRVLRSKTTRPQYTILNSNNSVLNIVKTQNPIANQDQHNSMRNQQNIRNLNNNLTQSRIAQPQFCISRVNSSSVNSFRAKNPMKDQGYVMGGQQNRSSLNNSVVKKNDFQLMPVVRCLNTPPRPTKRQRTVSGIYPLKSPEKKELPCVQYIPTVGFRWSDGKITKINAVIQKQAKNSQIKITPIPKQSIINQENNIRKTYMVKNVPKKPVVTIQDVINKKIDSHFTNNTKIVSVGQSVNQNIDIRKTVVDTKISTDNNNYIPNHYVPNLNHELTGQQTIDNQRKNDSNFVYYHKKIRSDYNMRVDANAREGSRVLPRINDAFSQFNDVQYKDLTQPLYVQVSEESERVPQHHLLNADNTVMLESIYNIKHQFLVNQPLLQIKTTTNTMCVYSTPLISSSVAHPSQVVVTPYHYSYERGSPFNIESETIPRLYDYMRLARDDRDFTCDEVLSSSSTSAETNPQLEDVTIPEMVDDALELISQDGDYMERLGIDGRMQCILCDWAGPKLIFENHIRKEHSSSMVEARAGGEWRVAVAAGRLRAGRWAAVLHAPPRLLALLLYRADDCLCAQLTSITESDPPPHGRLTVYNKLSGKPYVWEGEIRPIPDTLPDETGYSCLKLDISGLNLLPNNANLKFINGELVVVTSNKVILGKMDFSNIDIVLYVKLLQ